MTHLQTLLDRLKASTVPEDEKALVAAIAADLAGLVAAMATGQDVETELAHIQAQAANLTGAAAHHLSFEFRQWVTELALKVVLGTLV